jgi:TolA-binding protein
VNAFKEAADQDENNADARWWLAKSYANLGKDSKACKQYDEYLELAPRGSHASDAKAAVKKCG